jgi:recombination DNA repair RAD52 pathway protein
VSVNVTAIVRITLADGCWHEDVGCGQGENIKSKGGALDKVDSRFVSSLNSTDILRPRKRRLRTRPREL